MGFSELYFRLPYEDVRSIRVLQQTDGDLKLICRCKWCFIRWTRVLENWTAQDIKVLIHGLKLTAIEVEVSACTT